MERLDKLAEKVKAHPGVTLDLSRSAAPRQSFRVSAGRRSCVRLQLISVPHGLRGQGLAERTLERLCREMDKNRCDMVLTASGVFGSDPERLREFYASFGFVSQGDSMHMYREFQVAPALLRA